MFKALKHAGLKGKTALVRADFNVPLDGKGDVGEDERLVAAIPTIEYLLKNRCKVIMMSHLGRPKGVVEEGVRLDGVAKRLSELLNVKVRKLNDCVGKVVSDAVADMKEKDIILLENLRFHRGEEENSEELSQLQSFCRRSRGSFLKERLKRLAACWKIRNIRLLPFLAARKFQTSSS